MKRRSSLSYAEKPSCLGTVDPPRGFVITSDILFSTLSIILNGTRYGYKIQNRSLSHLFYKDDLKLFAKDDNNLEEMLQLVEIFIDDIGMVFGLVKCANVSFKRGKLTGSASQELEIATIIKDLNQEEFYMNLGINESGGILHSQTK